MDPITLHLTASATTAPAPIERPTARHLTASAEARTIGGAIVEYGVVGYASTGPTIFEAGSLSFPADLGRVKFLLMHDMERPIGVMSALAQDGTTPRGEFTVLPGALGDTALAEAADGRRDGLSVGVMITDYEYRDSDGVLVVRAARVTEVSLVTIPAFENALVSTASLKGTDMSQTQQAPAPQALTASTPAAPAAEPTEPPAAPTPAPQAAAAAVQTPAPAPQPAAAASTPPEPQAPPIMVTGTGTDLDTLSARIAGHFATGGNGSNLTAALTDVLVPDDGGDSTTTKRGQWVDELWQATRTERPIIDSIAHKPLKSLRVYGWKRIYPEGHLVDKYDGGKAAIPASGKMTTAPDEVTAQRWAGGWDVDRAFVDFNDEQFIRMTLEAATDDYKMQTEADVVAQFLAAATIVPDVTTLTGALTQLGLRSAGLGSRISRIQFGATAWAKFLDLPTDQVPWWLQKQGTINLSDTNGNAGGLSFSVNQELPADELLAYDSRAATFYEKTPPVQVQALDISRGGVDLGVFGYTALMINDPRAIFQTTITEPAA